MDRIVDEYVFADIPYRRGEKGGDHRRLETNDDRSGNFIGNEKQHPYDQVGKNR